jgi:hypothetical protein
MQRRFMVLGASIALFALSAWADNNNNSNGNGNGNGCNNLPSYTQLKAALIAATNAETSGLNMNMWGAIVDRDGIVCAIAFTGTNRGAQWPGSRVISAQKANTANSFSLDPSAVSGVNGLSLALSTANLYSAVQPGGSLYGLQASNPVDTDNAYQTTTNIRSSAQSASAAIPPARITSSPGAPATI